MFEPADQSNQSGGADLAARQRGHGLRPGLPSHGGAGLSRRDEVGEGKNQGLYLVIAEIGCKILLLVFRLMYNITLYIQKSSCEAGNGITWSRLFFILKPAFISTPSPPTPADEDWNNSC